ncbi:Stk1 family PASTA domain-containing Ser/Thr kinase [Pseudoramibacter alactolyticus]|uniref:Stk1 family PASTA domain-containing Ser/Thr kinase n=1 Tax=Pseudoramibacter alactolyticus TaxID=113287 RepID=UPI002356CA70|nr:Stk1 family PASTA domain-containing Ser/Thr kinase [Pseudoramibacter alactolyticus]MBM6967805.1 Stk1 family PASTA domain-containing Ser/Thr kinase [Pseudoramibacter alactolyticus]
MIGKILNGRYEIIELIGRGGMAYVYKARDLKLNRFVAVKILREEYTENEQFIKKFDRESQSAAGLSDPNIVSVYDVGVDGDVYFIVMEYVDGITLKQYLIKKGRLDYEEATNFIIDVAEALQCAHEHGIIHRDIKPQNIMLTADMTPKVTDFGIARAITSSTITMTNQTMGSVHYISPEQARGGFVDERSDLYSLGIMYYELLTGELPFDEENTVSIAIKHIQEDITPPKTIFPEIPQSVSDVVVRLCQKRPDDRYQDCEELITDLDQIMLNASVDLNGSPNNGGLISDDSLFQVEPEDTAGDAADETGIDDLRKKKKRKRVLIGLLVAALAIAGIVAGYRAFSASRKVTVPDVSGMTKSQAKTAVEAVGLTLEVESTEYSDTVDRGKIISQSPKANAMSREGRTVKVVISKGSESVQVPNVVGMTENEAVSALEKANLQVAEIKREYNDSYSSGVVYNASPSAGSAVDKNSKVTLYVSKGKETVSVPGLVGLTQNDAESRIKANGFTVGTVTQQYSDSYASGVVMSQSPSEGTQIEKGTTINFVVSKGVDPNSSAAKGSSKNDDSNEADN